MMTKREVMLAQSREGSAVPAARSSAGIHSGEMRANLPMDGSRTLMLDPRLYY
jgi:hypothetical protein